MLGELVQRTSDEFDIRLRDCDPIRHEVPKLIGIRHCIHHQGLIGVNVGDLPSSPTPTVCMHLESLRKHGDWGGNNPTFRTFFRDEDEELLVLRPLVENSERKCDRIVAEVIGRLEEEYGEDELLRETADVGLYR